MTRATKGKAAMCGLSETPCAERSGHPLLKALLLNGAVDDAQVMPTGDLEQGITERQPVGDGKSAEEPAWVGQLIGVDFKIIGARRWKRGLNDFLQIPLQSHPLFFRHEERAKHEDRLGGIRQTRAGISGFVKVDEVHGLIVRVDAVT